MGEREDILLREVSQRRRGGSGGPAGGVGCGGQAEESVSPVIFVEVFGLLGVEE